MNTVVQHLKLVFSHKKYRSIALIASLLFLGFSFVFFKYALSLGNVGKWITHTEILLNILLALLFGIFLAGQIYKIKLMDTRKKIHKRGFLGGLLGVVVTGCPSCTMGLASFLGIGSTLSLLPWHGLELKLIALVLLGWSIWNIYKNLLVCKVKK